MSWNSTTVKLEFPIEFEGKTYEEIILREPDVEAAERIAKASEGMDEGKDPTMPQVRATIAALAGSPDDLIKKVHVRDFRKMAEAIGPLLAALD